MSFKLSPSGIRRSLLLLALLTSAAGFSGCATLTRGTTETIIVQSEPSGATVRLSNGFTGVTPASFKLSRKGDLIVSISKEGYQTAEISVKSQIAGRGAVGLAGNVLIGGIIGVGVDAASGATLSHYPNPVKTTLIALQPAAPLLATPVQDPMVPAVPAMAEPKESASATTKTEPVRLEENLTKDTS